MDNTQPLVIGNGGFTENGQSKALNMPTESLTASLMMNLFGTITVTGSPSSNPQTSFFSALTQLFGAISILGQCNDSSTGMQIQNIPMNQLAYMNFIETGNTPNNSGPTSGLTATTYDVNIAVPLLFYDPRAPQAQWRQTYFNPARYSLPYLQISFGQFNAASVGANRSQDLIAYIGTATYTMSLNYQVTAQIVPGVPFSKGDQCLDLQIEYFPEWGIASNLSDANGIQFSNRDLQAYTYMLNTQATSAGIESGVNNLGQPTPAQFLQSRFGATPFLQWYPNNMQSDDQQMFLKNQTWPTGAYVWNMYNNNFKAMRKKTLLKTQGVYFFDTNLGALPGGASWQNVRAIHKTWGMSTSLKNAIGPKLRKFAA